MFTYGLGPKPEGWQWADLVIIILVALSVMLAVLTIFLAVLGIWGYTQLKHDAREVAEKVAKEEVPGIAKPVAARQVQSYLMSREPHTDDLVGALSKGDDDDGRGPGTE